MGMGPSNRPNLNSQPSNGEPALQGPEHGAPDPQDSLTEEPVPEVSNSCSYFLPFPIPCTSSCCKDYVRGPLLPNNFRTSLGYT